MTIVRHASKPKTSHSLFLLFIVKHQQYWHVVILSIRISLVVLVSYMELEYHIAFNVNFNANVKCELVTMAVS